MENDVYFTKIECPICEATFSTGKVRSSSLRTERVDSDFLTHYKSTNPLLYEVNICEFCGFAGFTDDFSNHFSEQEKKKIVKSIVAKWDRKSFGKERDIDQAIECFKILYKNYEARNVVPSKMARTFIRIAWLYRLKDETQKENSALGIALEYYLKAYGAERFPIGKFDESTCLYIIGEIYRRLGNLEDARKWYSKILSLPADVKNPKILSMTTDIIQELKGF